MANHYVALIADVVASRRLPAKARGSLQTGLRAAVRELNSRYRRRFVARCALTLGDELQALLPDATLVWELSHDLRHRFPAVDWIVACGRGALTTPLRPGASAPELDGPCFHAARAALEHAKRHRIVLAFEGFDPRLMACAAYYSALYWGWTRRQRALATAQRAQRGVGVDALARQLVVGPSAISHLRRRMGWPLVAAGDSVFRDWLAS
jgi:SatD family (SatD)